MDPTDQPDIIGIGESGDADLQVGELLMSCPLEVADEVQGVHLEPLAADAVPTAAGEPPLVGMTEIAAVYGAPSEGFWAIPMSLYDTP